MSASELKPRIDTQRHPKACKVPMFTRHEQVWLDVVNSNIQAGKMVDIAINRADAILEAFKHRFE